MKACKYIVNDKKKNEFIFVFARPPTPSLLFFWGGGLLMPPPPITQNEHLKMTNIFPKI